MDDLIFPDKLLYTYNNFPWLIVWNNRNNYFIHSKLNMLIKNNKKKYDIAVLLLSLRLPNGGLHATLVIYDFKRNIIERFDPYGNTSLLDGDIETAQAEMKDSLWYRQTTNRANRLIEKLGKSA